MWRRISVRNSRPADIRSRSGASGDMPAGDQVGVHEILTTYLGKILRANVVFPAPLGPAMIQQMGRSRSFMQADPARQ